MGTVKFREVPMTALIPVHHLPDSSHFDLPLLPVGIQAVGVRLHPDLGLQGHVGGTGFEVRLIRSLFIPPASHHRDLGLLIRCLTREI